MDNKQEEILKELKYVSEKLGHSVKKREAPNLANGCYRYFGSFNEAKKKSGLEIVNVRIVDFPRDAFKFDKELVKIVAYLTADGHLYKDLKGFHFYSKDKKSLEELDKIIYKKFGLKGKYNYGTGYGKSFRYTIFNYKISSFLNEIGAPSGDKMLSSFDVPEWIKNDLELSREYLKILFYCEGSKCKHSKNTEKIKINFNKSEKLLKDGINFTDSIKDLLNNFDIRTTNTWISLNNFDIRTTNTWISEGNKRKDKEITKRINFQIKSNSNNTFIKEIGWLK